MMMYVNLRKYYSSHYNSSIHTCNPAIFYYCLGNISPKYRSTERSIQLLAIAKTSVLENYGADCILKNLMEEIKMLEVGKLSLIKHITVTLHYWSNNCIFTSCFPTKNDGVTFNVNGQDYKFQGTLTIVPGDNLASQYLGGFKNMSRALRRCRQCMGVDSDIQTKVYTMLQIRQH